jgi:hypothetical protein
VISIKIIEKRNNELSHKTFDCAKIIFLSWYNLTVRRPLLNDISFNTVELDFVDLPNYIKIKLLIGDCGFYINEIKGMYLDVIGRNLLKKLYHERNIIMQDKTRGNDINLLLHYSHIESICYCFLNSFCLTNYLSTVNWFDKEV